MSKTSMSSIEIDINHRDHITEWLVEKTTLAMPKARAFEKLSPKGKLIVQFLVAGGNDQAAFKKAAVAFAQIAAVAIDDDPVAMALALREERGDVKATNPLYLKGMPVVPTANPNGHNYELEVPVVILEDRRDTALKADGYGGNHLPADAFSVRVATKKEVQDMVAGASKKWLDMMDALMGKEAFKAPAKGEK